MTDQQTPSKNTSVLSVVDVTVHLLEGAVATIPQGQIPAEVLALLGAALDNLIKFQGQAVTFGQLEDMRLKPTWPTVPGS